MQYNVRNFAFMTGIVHKDFFDITHTLHDGGSVTAGFQYPLASFPGSSPALSHTGQQLGRCVGTRLTSSGWQALIKASCVTFSFYGWPHSSWDGGPISSSIIQVMLVPQSPLNGQYAIVVSLSLPVNFVGGCRPCFDLPHIVHQRVSEEAAEGLCLVMVQVDPFEGCGFHPCTHTHNACTCTPHRCTCTPHRCTCTPHGCTCTPH